MRRTLLAGLLGAVAIGLVACGGEGSDDEGEIRAVIAASATSRDPVDCRRYNTLHSLEQAFKLQGDAALQACEQTKLEDRELPTGVEVTKIEVDGDRATARVASVGGPYEEQEPLVALSREDGTWKEDEIVEFVVFDREAFVLEFGREALGEAQTAAEADAYACVVGRMDQLGDAELEAVLLDFSPQPLLDLVQPCEPRSAST